MNQTENFNQVEKILNCNKNFWELKEKQRQFTKNEKQYWEIGAEMAGCEILLKNLTSICLYCQQGGANFDLENEGKLAHYECYQKWWELNNAKEIND